MTLNNYRAISYLQPRRIPHKDKVRVGWSVDRNAQQSRESQRWDHLSWHTRREQLRVILFVTLDLVREELCTSPFSERSVEKTRRQTQLSDIGFLDR